MGIFERYLSVWVAASIAVGVGLGLIFPPLFELIASITVANVNLVVALFIWVMIYPMMVQIDFSTIKKVGKNPQGLLLTIIINWLIKPFSMAALGWLFFEGIFASYVSPESAQEYIAGMILLGVAPCTAMVFVWSQLTKGDANYTLIQVSVNDVIMIFAFAPIAGLLLGVSDIHVPWNTLFISVVLYVLLPLMAGIVTRKKLNNSGKQDDAINTLLTKLKPFSVIGLLATVALLFGFQANTIISQPFNIVLIAIPLILQTYGIFFIAYFAALKLKLKHNIAAPACLIGTSNFFELAVAVAISLFGLHSGAALATVVGVLVEVPVMLSLVAIVNKTKHWFNS
ncbi:arsenic transporter [Pseudoalteromonas luteoviolacea CPMOR-2]|uniref:ACR3 family arsenite efflux transporter n=1 Tax=Pseudoalteromonas luteoviolacea TaxID=43657 RepID=UPI0007B0A3D7|nr:ACR3 family arsenite efflux transporter [Pseudoalteromonas luteoviolacea]KZN52327.1 arsenic transporter [Pseudoalteromonas luteoviolacea CPMOR-2]